MQTYDRPGDPLLYAKWLNRDRGWQSPKHLHELADLFERIAHWARGDSDEIIRALITYPIRHWKTETILSLTVWLLEQVPSLRIMLMSHDIERVEWMGKRIRQLCQSVAAEHPTLAYIGPAKGWNRLDHWENIHGGGVTILSSQQSREGFTVHVLIVDDPVNEKQIKKQEDRDAADHAISFYTGRTMLFRNGGNVQGPVILVASRFSQDDMTGRRLERGGWEYYYNPAVNPDGTAFAPEIFSKALLDSNRAEMAKDDPREEVWWSRWMGKPLGERGQDKFKPNPATYDFLPPGKDATGIYIIGERQWFAIVHLRISKGCAFVRSCQRFVAEPNELASRLKEIPDRGEVYAFISVHERIAVRRMLERGVTVTPLTEGQNRLWRSLRTIQLWEENRILWPADGSGKANIARISKFTGSEDEDPDEVDALVAVIEGAMLWANADRPIKFGKRRYE